MARYKHYDYNQTKMIPLCFADQIQPGSFEQPTAGNGGAGVR